MQIRNSFYKAAKFGIATKIKWFDGREYDLKELCLRELIPKSSEALIKRGLDIEEVNYFLNDIIQKRVESGLTGSMWQKIYVHKYGPRFQEMMEVYYENQLSNKPVHSWSI